MAKRILLAGVLGGLGLFFWGAISHTVLGLGDAGMQYLPQSQATMQSLAATVPQSGFYAFPQGDRPGTLRPDQVGGPYGILIYHSSGAPAGMGGQLLNEFILNVGVALLAAFLLSLASGLGSYGARVGFVFVVGAIAGSMNHIEYWNWYGYPSKFTLASILDNLIGFLVIGLIAAAFVKPAVQGITAVPAKAA